MLERYYQSANQLCTALSHNSLEAFLLSLRAMLTTTEDVVMWFVSKQGALSAEACLVDLELTSVVVKHHATLLIIREAIAQHKTQALMSDTTAQLCKNLDPNVEIAFSQVASNDGSTYVMTRHKDNAGNYVYVRNTCQPS